MRRRADWRRSAAWACWSIKAFPPSRSGPAKGPGPICSTAPPARGWPEPDKPGKAPALALRKPRETDMTLTLARNIYFTGFMASGKSRIGQLTAASLGRKFFDTDKLIEEKCGKPIPRI